MRQNEALNIWQDWDESEGLLRWENAKTIDLYKELKDRNFNLEEAGIFIAFTREQYDAAVKRLHLDGVKLYCVPGCRFAYGSEEGIDRYWEYCEECERRITAECVPQEVYCYEFNNYESAFNGDGDEGALRIIVRYWGWEVARKIKRYTDWPKLDDLEARMAKEAANEKA